MGVDRHERTVNQTSDIHLNGPSRLAAFVYRYDTSHGQFIRTRQTNTTCRGISETDPNLIRPFGDFRAMLILSGGPAYAVWRNVSVPCWQAGDC